jgi:hypothetical protein
MILFDTYETRETINDLGYRYKFQPLEDSDNFLLITYHNGSVIAQREMEFSPYWRDDTIAEMSFEVACNHWLESILA